VHERSGLEGLARLFMSELLACQPAELFVNEGQKLAGGVRVASVNCSKDAGDFT